MISNLPHCLLGLRKAMNNVNHSQHAGEIRSNTGISQAVIHSTNHAIRTVCPDPISLESKSSLETFLFPHRTMTG